VAVPAFQQSLTIQNLNGQTSILGDLPEGLTCVPLNQFLNQNAGFKALYEKRNPLLDQNSLYHLNDAFNQNPLVFCVHKGTPLDISIVHQFILEAQAEPTVIQGKIIIYLEEGASFTWIEQQASLGSNSTIFSNYALEIWLSEQAHLTLYKDQDLGNGVSLVDHTFIYQAANSQVDMFTFSINGTFVRNNLHFYIEGPNVVSNLNGLYVPGEGQLMDNHSVVDHRMPHSESNELYKGVLLGNATGVFNGKIFVRKDAQKTNAFQSCKNVLASDRATMNTKPQLEIWADDVKCSHGTTTGQLSEEALFYMRSRGISADAARTLLLLAFVQQVIDKVEIISLRDYLSAKIIQKIEQSWEA
jgi:Fe-S cluster assembly protein SufD